MAKPKKREFLQLAFTYNPAKHNITNWLVSEKLDGCRAFWDGRVSRGMLCSEVPWANTLKDKKEFTATGLWSRYGKPIFAPEWFLNQLPVGIPLDGELFAGRGKHQTLRSATSKHIPIDSEWQKVKYCIFDSPNLCDVLYNSTINITNFQKTISGMQEFFIANNEPPAHHGCKTYAQVYQYLQDTWIYQPNMELVLQTPMHMIDDIDTMLAEIVSSGGEGLICRDPYASYVPWRAHSMVKLKPSLDSEAVVVGYITGRETDKGSKLLGLMGAMIVEWRGKRFELSGFTGEERTLHICEGPSRYNKAVAFDWAAENPETRCPGWIEAKHFPKGSKVTFCYRELTDKGIPKEARFLRPRGDFE